jgi:hypothetical protein
VAVLPSLGVVRLAQDPVALLASVGDPVDLDRTSVTRWSERGQRVEGAVGAAVPVEIGGEAGRMLLRTADRSSSLGFGVLEDQEARRGGVLAAWTEVRVGGVDVPGGWVRRDESLRDPRPDVVGVLGADLLATVDVAVDPVAGRIAVRPAEDPLWTAAAAEDPDDGGQDCRSLVSFGSRQLATGDEAALDTLGKAEQLYRDWAALTPAERERIRAGKPVDGVDVSEQPCDDVPLVMGEIRRAPWRWSEKELRDAIAAGHADDPVLRAALAVKLADRSDRPWIPAEVRDDHPLTTALVLGPDLAERILAEDPRWLAGRALVRPDDPDLERSARLERARHPGDPAPACLYALVAGEPIPEDPEADCLAARWISAARDGEDAITRQSWSDLVERWPMRIARESPQPIGGPARMVTRPPSEAPMLPLAALSTVALADSGPFDQSHAQLAVFLKGAVTDAGAVDYALLKSRRGTLDGYLAGVKVADTTGWTSAQKLALYVNAYNAYTLATMLDNGPPASIQAIDGGKVWDTRTFVVAGESLTLNQIENGKVRAFGDDRVHGVLNCASKGCPPLYATPLTATDQGAQLDAAAKRWVRTNAYHLSGSAIALSEIFDWYSTDFAKETTGDIPGVDGKAEAALWFLAKYSDDSATKAKLTAGGLTPSWQTYDWSSNAK